MPNYTLVDPGDAERENDTQDVQRLHYNRSVSTSDVVAAAIRRPSRGRDPGRIWHYDPKLIASAAACQVSLISRSSYLKPEKTYRIQCRSFFPDKSTAVGE